MSFVTNPATNPSGPTDDTLFDLGIRHIAAFGSACILLVGRWSFDRLNLQNLDLSWVPSLRALGIVFLALLTLHCVAKKPRISRNSYIIPLVAFLGWMMVTALWSPQPEAANEKLADVALLGIFLVSFHQLAIRIGTDRFLALFARYFLLLLGLLTASALFHLNLADTHIVGPVNRKIFVLGSGPNVFGRNMALLTIFLLIQMKRGWLTPVSIGVAGISTFLVLLSGSRGALLELIIGLLFTLVFIKRSVWLRIAIPPLLLIPLALTDVYQSLMWNPPDGTAEVEESTRESLWGQTLDVLDNRVMHHTVKNFHDSSRTDLFATALQMGMGNPIGGVGLGGYQWENPAKTVVLHYPHNLVAEAWAEGGGIGLILLLVIGIRFAWRFLPTIRSTWGLLSAGVLVSGIFSMLSGDIYDSRVLLCLALAWMLKHDSIPISPVAGRPQPNSGELSLPFAPRS
ncbi:MAG: O-antigen ligase family protein [Planctomycetota bacterium]|jgi:O-antigen ligase|nr:O-antigen ligase family protein [Planctomycetota bacterium]